MRLFLKKKSFKEIKKNMEMYEYHLACHNDDVEKIKEMLERKDYDVNLIDENGRTVFYIACFFNKHDIIRLLCKDERIDINKPGKDGDTPFINLCSGNKEGLRCIWRRNDLDINKKDNYGMNAIKASFHFNCHRIARSLFDRTDLIIDDEDKKALIFQAYYNQNHELIKLVHEKTNLGVNILNDEGESLFFACVKKNLKRSIRLLCRNPDLDVNIKNSDNNSVIFLLCENKNDSHHIFDMLMVNNKKIDMNVLNEVNSTPLIEACYENNELMIKYILDIGGFDINHKNVLGDGHSAFMASLINNKFCGTKMILSSHQDIEISNTTVRLLESNMKFKYYNMINGHYIDLINEYLENPLKTRMRLRIEFGFAYEDAVYLLLMTRLYLNIDNKNNINNLLKDEMKRYLSIVKQMPDELLMKITNNVYGLKREFISQDKIQEFMKTKKFKIEGLF